MKIQLPNQSHLFEKAFTAAIETTKSCEVGISFLAHFIGLMQALRHHPITENWVKGLEQENQKRKEAFNVQAIEALETEWLFLWKNYPQKACRKELVRIKQLLTKNKDLTSQMPFSRICNAFLEFKIKFNCDECSEKLLQFLKNNQQHRISANKVLYAQYIQTSVELDPVYFWDRLCLLERIHQSSSHFHTQQPPIQGKWEETKYLHWERVSNSSFQMASWLARQDLWARFARDGFSNDKRDFILPLDLACKFSRKACEKYLDRLLTYVRSILLKEEKDDTNKTSNPVIEKKTLPQQKTDELIKHTKAHWDKHPTANYDEVYGYYCNRCRFPKPYSSDEWEKKVRKLKLDPRPPSEKVRGFSKKGR
jgi:hypothetical protein